MLCVNRLKVATDYKDKGFFEILSNIIEKVLNIIFERSMIICFVQDVETTITI